MQTKADLTLSDETKCMYIGRYYYLLDTIQVKTTVKRKIDPQVSEVINKVIEVGKIVKSVFNIKKNEKFCEQQVDIMYFNLNVEQKKEFRETLTSL